MRSLLLFSKTGQGRSRITSAPPVGSETIFSESFLQERAEIEWPGMVGRDQQWPLPPGSIITVTPSAPGQNPMTFVVNSIGPYDPPTYVNVVAFCTRLT